jgi:vitamin B12 transporter
MLARADDQLDPLVVTATRMPQPVSKSLADVTVIGRDAIERQVAGSVADVLRTVPGVSITRNGDSASTTSVMIRGSETRHVLVLVDGVPMDSQSTGGATWEAIPLQWVERIEVVRGPASVVYGSDAMGGVVQIFTRKGKGAPHVEAGLGLSDQSTLNGDLSLMGAVGAWDFALGVAAETSHGFNASTTSRAGKAAADRDGHTSNTAQFKLGWLAAPGQRVQLGLSGQHVNNMYDASPTSNLNDQALKDSSHADLSWTADWLPNWRSAVALGQSTDAYEARTSYIYNTSTRVQTASVVNQLKLGDHALRATLERREDHLLNSDLPVLGDAGRGDQAANALGLGYEWQSELGALSGTLREDHSDRFGAHRTGALAAAWVIQPGDRLRASVGTAFRSPTLYQMFSTYGDPNLKPESSRTRELAFTHERDGLNLGITAFRTTYDQLIGFGALGTCLSDDPIYGGCYRNTAHAVIQGVTLSGGFMVMDVRLTASADFLSPKNSDTGKLLQRRAQREGKMRAEWAWADWLMGAQAQVVGKRFDDVNNTKALGGYALYGLDASRHLTPETSVVLRVDNLANHAYQTAMNYAQAPRTVFIGLRWAPGL